MPNQVSIVIPIAPYHLEIAQRAIDSAAAQTVACDILTYTDTESRGAGYARNKCLAEVESDFVVFLDADDWIYPEFVEKCLKAWQPNKYVFVDWEQEDGIHVSPDGPWQLNGLWHPVTALLPTQAVKAVGGFDERVRFAEDTIMFWGLTRAGVCGIHLNEPLFWYGKEGRRAKENVNEQSVMELRRFLVERHGDGMCCGGDNPIKPNEPGQKGDIEALAMWGGNQRVLGVISGRLYPRASYPHIVMVDPRDVEARPDQWQKIQPPQVVVVPKSAVKAIPEATNTYIQHFNAQVLNGVQEVATVMRGGSVPVAVATKAEPTVLTADQLRKTITPDAGKVRRLAGKGKK